MPAYAQDVPASLPSSLPSPIAVHTRCDLTLHCVLSRGAGAGGGGAGAGAGQVENAQWART